MLGFQPTVTGLRIDDHRLRIALPARAISDVCHLHSEESNCGIIVGSHAFYSRPGRDQKSRAVNETAWLTKGWEELGRDSSELMGPGMSWKSWDAWDPWEASVASLVPPGRLEVWGAGGGGRCEGN